MIMKNLTLVLFLLFAMTSMSAQEGTYYYGANGRIVDRMNDARMMKSVKKIPGKRYRIVTKVKHGDEWRFQRSESITVRNDSLHIVRYNEQTFFPRKFRRAIKAVDEHSYLINEFNRSGTLRTANCTKLIPLHLDGRSTEYYRSGNKKSESIYVNNMLQSNYNWNQDGSEYFQNIFYSADVPPKYIYGNQAFQNYMIDRMAKARLPIDNIQDELIIGAVVMETGELSGVKIVKGRVPSVNQFFIESIESLPGKWKPAVLNGEKVRYFIQIPINFKNNLPEIQNVELTKGGQLFWND